MSARSADVSIYEYKPLYHSKNEIRVLRFPAPDGTSKSLIHCTLHHMSLNDLLPKYATHLRISSHLTPTGTVRRWLESQGGVLSTDSSLKPPAIDKWRLSAENLASNSTCTPGDIVRVPCRFKWGDFEAISYCWESNRRDSHVLVD